MNELVQSATRRSFVGAATTGLAALAGISLLPHEASAASHPTVAAEGSWDMSWTAKLTGPRRAVFELPNISDGMGLHQANLYMEGYRAAHGDVDGATQVVIVMRAGAVPMAFTDVIWEKYGLAAELKTRGPRNPFLAGEDATLGALRAKGAILLACNMATMGQATHMAQKAGADVEAVKAEVRANLAPGVLLMPNGVFAVLRAQDAGCKYFKASA